MDIACDHLRQRLAALATALREVEAAAGDRPPGEPDLLAERIEDTVTEVSAQIQTAQNDARGSGTLALVRLAAIDGILRAALRSIDAGLSGADARQAFAAMARRRGGGWPAWYVAFTAAVTAAWDAALAAGDAIHLAISAESNRAPPSLRLAN